MGMVGMRKRWENRTLIGSGYVDEKPISFSRESAREMGWERAHMVNFCQASQRQNRIRLHKCVAAEGTAG
jgi:hypothetical protein